MTNFTELEIELKRMKPRQKLYELVKQEMMARGRWKKLARGDGGAKLKSLKQK